MHKGHELLQERCLALWSGVEQYDDAVSRECGYTIIAERNENGVLGQPFRQLKPGQIDALADAFRADRDLPTLH
jgi:hypothetical protein